MGATLNNPHTPTNDSPLGILIDRINELENQNKQLVKINYYLIQSIQCSKVNDSARDNFMRHAIAHNAKMELGFDEETETETDS